MVSKTFRVLAPTLKILYYFRTLNLTNALYVNKLHVNYFRSFSINCVINKVSTYEFYQF
jgi:hypothetical protein